MNNVSLIYISICLFYRCPSPWGKRFFFLLKWDGEWVNLTSSGLSGRLGHTLIFRMSIYSVQFSPSGFFRLAACTFLPLPAVCSTWYLISWSVFSGQYSSFLVSPPMFPCWAQLISQFLGQWLAGRLPLSSQHTKLIALLETHFLLWTIVEHSSSHLFWACFRFKLFRKYRLFDLLQWCLTWFLRNGRDPTTAIILKCSPQKHTWHTRIWQTRKLRKKALRVNYKQQRL